MLGSARQKQWRIYLFVLSHGTSPFRLPSVFSTNHRQSRFFQRSTISLLTGIETPQISPPSLAFNWMPIFVATDINWFFFEIVFANTIWRKRDRSLHVINIGKRTSYLWWYRIIQTHVFLQGVVPIFTIVWQDAEHEIGSLLDLFR